MLHIGTSGFSYKDWVGPFYPSGTKLPDMLRFYQTEFSTVELDYTYYTMPRSGTLNKLADAVGDDFTFSIRTHKSITHDKGLSMMDVLNVSKEFSDSLIPLVDKGKFGSLLIQYPWSFRMNQENADRLLRTAEVFKGIRTAVEFRNDSWANEKMISLLESNGLALCCVDEPRLPGLFPPLPVATADFSYFRFHGRNKRDWWNARPCGDRYDYDYGDDELDEWVPGIHKVMSSAKDSYIYLNNCHMGNAARNAKALKKKLLSNA